MPSDTPFSELAQVNPPRPALDLRDLDPVSFIPMGNVSESGRWTEQQSRPYGEVRRGYTYCAEGDVLFAKITPCTENGKGCHAIGLTNGVGFASTEFHVLHAKEGVDPRYIFQWSVSLPLRLNAAAHMTGSAGQQRVPADFFSRFTVPKLPLPEQSKIAEMLSTVDRAIEQTEALIAKHQRIKTGLLQDLLTRGIDEHGNLRSEQFHEFKDSPLGQIPVEWNPMPFGSCGQWFSGGTPSKAIRRFWGGGVPWVCPKDMKQFELLQSIDTITGDAVAAGARLMPTGTVFIVIRGMILAHTFPVGVSTTEVAFNQDVKAIVPKQGLMGRYLAYWLSSHSHQFLKLATTATHGTKRFDMDELQAALVGVPLPNEQKRIVRIFDEQQSVIERLQGLTAKLQAEKRGLMKDLLTGDRRVTALLGSSEQVVDA